MGKLEKFIEALKSRPDYILVLAIAGPSGLVGIGSGAVGVGTQRVDQMLIGLAGSVLACFTALYAIRMGHRADRVTSVSKATDSHKDHSTSPDHSPLKYQKFLESLSDNMVKCERVSNDVFHEYVNKTCSDFLNSTADWAQKIFTVPLETNGFQVLVSSYASAKTSIFATSDVGFSKVWPKDVGVELSRAHLKGAASLTRVFVFDCKGDVTEAHYEVMRQQSEIDRTTVKVFFDKEDTRFEFDTDLTRDFTIVDDGEAIGITMGLSKGDSDLRAKWFFEHGARKPHVINVRDDLNKFSVSFREFDDWWKENKS